MRARGLTLLGLAGGLLACGPPPLDLLRAQQAGLRPPEAVRAVREACADHGWASSCRVALAEACGRVDAEAVAAAAADFARRRFVQVAARVAQPAEGCAAGAELTRMGLAAGAIEACARAGDDACELAVARRLDQERAEVPALAPWLDRQRVALCGLALAEADTAELATAWPAVVRLCTPAERGGLRARLVAAVAQGAQAQGTAAALDRCAVMLPLDPGDEALREACGVARDSLAQKLGAAVDAAWAAGRVGAAVALLAEGRRRGTPAKTGLDAATASARLDREARWPVALGAPRGVEQGLREAAVRALESSQPPAGYRWIDGAEADPLEVALVGVAGFQIEERRASHPASHRYLKGHRRVENPDWAPARRACRQAMGALKQCEAERARALRRVDACVAKRSAAEDAFERCKRQAVADGKHPYVVCRSPDVSCPSEPRRCETGSADHACRALDQTPRHIDEPVFAQHHYAIAEVTRAAGAEVAVRADREGGALGRWARQVRVQAVDRAWPPVPAVGLAGDPLDLPDEDALRTRVAAGAARVVTDALVELHQARCATQAGARARRLAEGDLGGLLDTAARDTAAGCADAAEAERDAARRVVSDL